MRRLGLAVSVRTFMNLIGVMGVKGAFRYAAGMAQEGIDFW